MNSIYTSIENQKELVWGSQISIYVPIGNDRKIVWASLRMNLIDFYSDFNAKRKAVGLEQPDFSAYFNWKS